MKMIDLLKVLNVAAAGDSTAEEHYTSMLLVFVVFGIFINNNLKHDQCKSFVHWFLERDFGCSCKMNLIAKRSVTLREFVNKVETFGAE